MPEDLRNYLVVTASYWAFTITDGAIRMLVVLYFFQRGYTPIEIAFLFLFYEFFGVVTNLLGGWVASRIGLNVTMHLGMGLQIIALAMLTAPEFLLTVPYVMAAQALWRHVTSIDLFPNISYWNAPVDDELRFRVTAPRHVRTRVNDTLWVRVLDVERVLAARSYVADGEIRLKVTDPLFEDLAGTYTLEVRHGAATCSRTEVEPELELGMAALGSLCLGGRDLAALGRAGLVSGNDNVVRKADAMFRWPVAPWCPEVF